MEYIDLTGQQIGRLLIKERVCGIKPVVFLCLCSCGKEKIISGKHLRNKKKPTISCGCYNRELSRIKKTKFPGKAGLNGIYTIYRVNALNKGLGFTITRDQFEEITQKNCDYCNASPSNVSTFISNYHERFIYNGIDRVDNTIGYLYENCVPCCEVCNKMKKAKTREDFINHISNIYLKCVEKRSVLRVAL